MSTQDSLHIPTYATVVPPPACEPNNLPPGFPIERLHRFSVDQYHRMVQAGVFDEDDRLELLDGVIVEMSPQGPEHARIIPGAKYALLDDPAYSDLETVRRFVGEVLKKRK